MQPSSTLAEFPLLSSGQALDLAPECFGELRRSDDLLDNPEAQRRRLAEDGYLYIPGFFPAKQIVAVRAEVLRRLAEAGALRAGSEPEEAIPAEKMPAGLRRIVLEGNQALREVVFGWRLLGFYERLLAADVAHFDHIWLRVILPGVGTPPHADSVYMNRGTANLLTGWIPYGQVTRRIGGLMVLENSHRLAGRLRHYLQGDVDTYCENQGPYKHKHGWLSKNPHKLRQRLGGRWLTSDFAMGDLVTFGMTTIHASLDNHGQCLRLSTDTRYQRAHEAIDPRWVGPDTEEYAAKNRVGKIC